MNSSNETATGRKPRQFRTVASAMRALNRAQSKYNSLVRRLDRIARGDACRGDLFVGWDWPTLRMVRPADWQTLQDLIATAKRCAAWVRFLSFVPAPAMEFSAVNEGVNP